MKRKTIGCGCASVIVLLFLLVLDVVFDDIPAYLVFGWIGFLKNVPPKTTFEPAAIAVGATALVLLVIVTHRLAGWLYQNVKAEQAESRHWQLRWSTASWQSLCSFLPAAFPFS